jgi:hypothetical protein
MRRLIAITLSLLCVALPLQTAAGAKMNSTHCPMMQAQKAQKETAATVTVQSPVQAQAAAHSGMHAEDPAASAAHTASSADHDCCNDAATFARTGEMCKPGQACSPLLAYLLPPAVLQPAIALQHASVNPVSIPFHTRPPGAVWRPPSLG